MRADIDEGANNNLVLQHQLLPSVESIYGNLENFSDDNLLQSNEATQSTADIIGFEHFNGNHESIDHIENLNLPIDITEDITKFKPSQINQGKYIHSVVSPFKVRSRLGNGDS